MRLHQIVSFAQSKMDAVFRFYLPWRKAKSPLSHLLESFCCWKLGKSPSCDEEPWAGPMRLPPRKWDFMPRLAGALCLGHWFLRNVATDREACNHPWKTFQTVLQASSRQREGPYFAFYVVLKSLQSTQLKNVASIKLRADYYSANSCHVIRDTGNVLRKRCLVLLISSFVFQVRFPENGAR